MGEQLQVLNPVHNDASCGFFSCWTGEQACGRLKAVSVLDKFKYANYILSRHNAADVANSDSGWVDVRPQPG
jgi:hypothetical protein